jgi:probable LLM family oxidoreductase
MNDVTEVLVAEKKQQTKQKLIFGLDTFGDIPSDDNGKLMSHAQAIRQVVAEAIVADELGVDVIALGEHHRPDYSISTPETVLAGIATVTKNITLASGVTVLSSDDPVRVYQRFATLDALSNGRAQVILGRGSFTESFPLFGYSLRDYETLFEEKIELFAELLKEKPVTWSGSTRAGLDKADVYPKTESGRLDTHIGVGGSPESVIRAARYGFPLMLAIIGGSPDRFVPYVELYRRAAADLGTVAHPIGMHSPGFIADTDQEARDIAWRPFKENRDRIGRDRGWPPLTRQQYEQEIEHGSLYIGSPETVAQKIAHAMKTLGAERFDLVYGTGPLSASARLRNVELFGREVIPRVRELLGEVSKEADK